MKKILLVLLIILLTSCTGKSGNIRITYNENKNPLNLTRHEYFEEIVMIKRYAQEGSGISFCEVEHGASWPLSEVLSKAIITDKKEPKLSNKLFYDAFKDFSASIDISIERGTFWIYANGLIYRFNSDMSISCIVEEELQEGKIIELKE